MLISILIPVFNEESSIKEILTKINKVKEIKKEIIVINDCSTDNTVELLEKNCLGLYNKINPNKKIWEKVFLFAKVLNLQQER